MLSLIHIFNEADNKLTVTLNNQTVDTDMVIMAIGVVPETKIVKNTEIATNSRGAIIVNDKMETSIKDIYACLLYTSFINHVHHSAFHW